MYDIFSLPDFNRSIRIHGAVADVLIEGGDLNLSRKGILPAKDQIAAPATSAEKQHSFYSMLE